MIVGFLGKGGSGKSSVATQVALFLREQDTSVLAIDADHNMDLSYNLTDGEGTGLPYFSQSLPELQKAVELNDGEKYSQAFLRQIGTRFTLTPLSPEIAKYSTLLPNGIRLMTAGPQTDNVLYGTHCSHSLTTPLKLLLPLLHLQAHEVAVVDEKAGADGVTTGIVTGLDVGVIVCEPALHSIKTALQIAELMDFYATPYVFVGNKVSNNEDVDFIMSTLKREPVAFFSESARVKQQPSLLATEWSPELRTLRDRVVHVNQNNRLERTVAKFTRNHAFAHG
jgi:CO dehydrogenase maturation factor